MDRESTSPAKLKAKRGRKGRPPKLKPTADEPSSFANSLPSVTNVDNGADYINDQQSETSASSDNLLMPPPPCQAQKAQSGSDNGGPCSDMKTMDQTEPLEDSEMLLEGFSICSFTTLQEVKDALQKRGNAYQNPRITLEKKTKLPRKCPRIPNNVEARSPSGKKGKGPARASSNKENRKRKSDGCSATSSPLPDSNLGETSAEPSQCSATEDSQPGISEEASATPGSSLNTNGKVSSEAQLDQSNKLQRESVSTIQSSSKHKSAIRTDIKSETKGKTKQEPKSPSQTPTALPPLSPISPPTSQIPALKSTPPTTSLYAQQHVKGGESIGQRSSSVPSVSSANSRQTTPVHAGRVDSRATSRSNSDRNAGSSHQPPSDPYNPLYAGCSPQFNPFNPAAMLSFGPNALGIPFNPAMAAAMGGAQNFGLFSGADPMSPFNNSSANQEALQLSRRMLLEASGMTGDRQLPPFLRPDLLYPPTSMGTHHGMPSLFPPAAVAHMFADKMPKIDPLHLLYHNNTPSGNMGSLGSSLPSTSLGPSPFQSVPGGSTTSPTESNPTSQKSGKWCNAHVRTAWNIYKIKQQKKMESGDESARSQDIKNKPGGALSHSISAITAIHKPKELPASVVPLLQPVANSAGSSSSTERSNVSGSTTNSTSSLLTVLPTSSFSAIPAKELLSRSQTSSQRAGAQSVPLVAASHEESSWSKVQLNPPTSSSSHSPLWHKRREDREIRKNNGTSSSPSGSRPVSSDRPAKRSRSRSPPENSVHRKARSPRHSDQRHGEQRHGNHRHGDHRHGDHRHVDQPELTNMDALRMRTDMLPHSLHPGMPPELAASQNALFSSMFGMMGDSKGLNGHQSWNPYGRLKPFPLEPEGQQREHMLMQMLAERDRYAEVEAQRRLLEHHQQGLLSSAALRPPINGFHHSAINSLPGAPPPLVPTSQSKMATTNPMQNTPNTNGGPDSHSR